MIPILSHSFSILFASPFICCICSVLCCFLELFACEVAQHSHTRSSCKFLICAIKSFSCVPCRRAKNMLRAFFCAARGCSDCHSVLVGRFEFFLSCFQRLTSSRFQVLSLQNVPRRQTPHSSPHLQFAQNFNRSHMVAPFLAFWPSWSAESALSEVHALPLDTLLDC